MDQDSYSRPGGRRQPSLSSSSTNYQINVSRQKTKKWVDAKSHNYDGDDWGADDDHQEEEEDDDDVVEPASSHLQQHEQQTHSLLQSRPAHSSQSPFRASNPSSPGLSGSRPQPAGGYPSQIISPTYSQPQRSPADGPVWTTPQAATSKPLTLIRPSDIYRRMEEEKKRASLDTCRRQSPDRRMEEEKKGTSLQTSRQSPDRRIEEEKKGTSLQTSRQSPDRRIEEEKKGTSLQTSRQSAEIGSNLPKQGSASPVKTAQESVKPTVVAHVLAPRSDSFNAAYQDLTSSTARRKSSVAAAMATPATPAAPVPAPPLAALASTATSRNPALALETPLDHLDNDVDNVKRLSISPKLPDLARMSVFGADFMSSADFQTPLSRQQTAEQNTPQVSQVAHIATGLKADNSATQTCTDDSSVSVPESLTEKTEAASATCALSAASASAASSLPATVSMASAKSTESQQPSTAAQLATKASSSSEAAQPQAQAQSLAAARKQVPPCSIDTDVSSRSATSAADSSPTKPLVVRKENSPAPISDPPFSPQREPTFGTDSSSPLKESDMLRDEIIKTLDSSTASNAQSPGTSRVDQNHAKPWQSRETKGSYTRRKDYDSHLTDSEDTQEAPTEHAPFYDSAVQQKTAEAVASKSCQVSSPVDSDTPAASPLQSPTPGQTDSVPQLLQPAQVPLVSPISTDATRRFSWEAKTSLEVAAKPSVASLAAMAGPNTMSSLTTASRFPTDVAASSSTGDDGARQEPTCRHVQPSAASKPSAPLDLDTDHSGSVEFRRQQPLVGDEEAFTKTSSKQLPTAPAQDDAKLKPTFPNRSVTPFKSIMDLSSSSERLAKFNESRISFAVMDTGLDRWLTRLHQDHPEHMSNSLNSYQPSGASHSGATPEAPAAAAAAAAQQPYYQQYLNASAPGSASSTGRRMGGIAISSSSNVGGSGFSHSSNQLGTKSKELMHSAGKMGKGLFSKGKNKLRGSGDKGDAEAYTPPPPPPPIVESKTRHSRQVSWPMLANKLRSEFSFPSKGNEAAREEAQAASELRTSTVAPCLPRPEPISPLIRENTPDWSLQSAQDASDNGVGTFLEETNAAAAAATVPPAISRPVAVDDATAMLSQAEESSEGPKRQSSFVGLPLMRRSSTFCIKTRARRAAERFPLDDDDDESSDASFLDMSTQGKSIANTALPGTAQQSRREITGPAAAQLPAVQTAHQTAMTSSYESVFTKLPSKPSSMTTRKQIPKYSVQLRSNDSSQPLLILPPGQQTGWRLEESHLSKPLQASKNRSGHSLISPPIDYGLAKETCYPALMPQPQPQPPQPSAGMRHRNTDVPPPSSQRYPGLFAPQPDDESIRRQRNNHGSGQGLANPRQSGHGVSSPSVGPPIQERNRMTQNSDFASKIGDNIVQTTWRDQRNSFAEGRPALGGHVDEASESSFGTGDFKDRKKHRSSLLNALAGRASMDWGSRPSFSSIQRPPKDIIAHFFSGDLNAGRRRSMFFGPLSGFSKAKDGSKAAAISKPVDEHRADNGVEVPIAPKQNRFSYMMKALQRPSQNQRPLSDDLPEPTISAGSAQRPNSRGRLFSSLGLAFRNNKSGDVSGPGDEASPGVDRDTSPNPRRRASFSNLLSTMSGANGGSRDQEGHGQPLRSNPFKGHGAPVADQVGQDISATPAQMHTLKASSPSRAAGLTNATPSLPEPSFDRFQPLFASGENHIGLNRPLTSTTIAAANEAVNGDAATIITGSPVAFVPAVTKPMKFADIDKTASTRENPAAPSEISNSETQDNESALGSSDVTPISPSRTDDEASVSRRDSDNKQHMTQSVDVDFSTPHYGQATQNHIRNFSQAPGQQAHFAQNPNTRATSVGNTIPGAYNQAASTQPSHNVRYSHVPHVGHGHSRKSFSTQYVRHVQQQQPKGNFNGKLLQSGLVQPTQQAEPNSASSKGWRSLKSKMAAQMTGMGQGEGTKQDRGDKAATGEKLLLVLKKLSGRQGSSGLRRASQQQSEQNQGPHALYTPLSQSEPHRMYTAQDYDFGRASSGQMSTQNRQHYMHNSGPQFSGQTGKSHSKDQQRRSSNDHESNVSLVGAQPLKVDGEGGGSGSRFHQAHASAKADSKMRTFGSMTQHSVSGSNMVSSSTSSSVSTENPHSAASSVLTIGPADVSVKPLPPRPAAAAAETPPPRPVVAALTPSRGEVRVEKAEEGGGSSTGLGSSRSTDLERQVSKESGVSSVRPSVAADVSSQLSSVVASHDEVRRLETVVSQESLAMTITSTRNNMTAVEAWKRDLSDEESECGAVSKDSSEMMKSRAWTRRKASMVSGAGASGGEQVAEMEDTAPARLRRLRIDGQEEKIFYDAEEDCPTMSATSYPGQEWNPFGEPGFGDWQE